MAEQDHKKKRETTREPELRKGIVSGWKATDFFQRHRWYIMFVFVLAVGYISYRFHAEQTILKCQRLEAELKVRQAEFRIKSEELTKLYERSKIIKQQRELELIESTEPPKRIGVN